MYDFDNGAVQLDCRGGVYEILAGGERVERVSLSQSQSRNPMLAINQFSAEITKYLKDNAKAYLRAQGYNTVMGCKNNMPCGECRRNCLNTADSDCLFGESRE